MDIVTSKETAPRKMQKDAANVVKLDTGLPDEKFGQKSQKGLIC